MERQERDVLLSNLLGKMKDLKIDNYQTRIKRKIANSPWARLPNISSFSIDFPKKLLVGLGSQGDRLYDPLFETIGIKKSLKGRIETEVYDNKRLNRYLEYQIRRLNKHRKNPHVYWTIAWALMKRSNTFRVAAFSKILPNWHRNYPLYYILHVNRKVSRIINNASTDFEFRRVYIPKGKDDWRPLGVPEVEWRIVLHLLNNFLVQFLDHKLLDSQHGFRPYKGTLSAWKWFFQNQVYKKKFIYEFDLQQCFPTISISWVSKCLRKDGCPDWVVRYLEEINKRAPKLPKDLLLDESRYDLDERYGLSPPQVQQTEKDRKLNKIINELKSPIYSVLKEIYGDAPDLIYELMTEDGYDNVVHWFQDQIKALGVHSPPSTPPQFEGVAQGSPTSPYITICALRDFLKQQSSLSYADDGLFFSDKPFTINDDKENGIVLKEKKSGWVKVNGKWVKPLKFLGLEFDGTNFYGNTRNGSKLLLGSKVKKVLKAIHILEKSGYVGAAKHILDRAPETSTSSNVALTSWQKIFESKVIGFVQNRIYNGRWELGSLEQDFRLKFVDKSWMSLHYDKIDTPDPRNDINVFNSTSYACRSLSSLFRLSSRLRKGTLNSNIRMVMTNKL